MTTTSSESGHAAGHSGGASAIRCPICAYDVRTTDIGAPCPECGTPVDPTFVPSGRLSLLGFVPMGALLFTAAVPELAAFGLLVALTSVVVLAWMAFGQARRFGPRAGRAAAWVACLTAIMPLIDGIALFAIFTIGGASNVAQLSGADDLWRLWFNLWLWLLLATLLSLVVSLVLLVSPPYRLAWVAAWALPLAAIAANLLALGMLVARTPSA